ncbi:MAG: 2,3-bisphosphoglycerate-dependent phosphoglycerate mutase [Actinomycetales bacterium]|nr:2,3-bisphosphoglycerate-dependent phosphoglycerate mutase [Actinomycetales bacterium]
MGGGALVLLRHGESEFNAAGVFTGLLDVDVTERGREQAALGARLLEAAGLAPERTWTSPMRRAAATTEILARELGLDPATVTPSWRLAERDYGSLTGVAKAEARERLGPEGYIAMRRTLEGSPGPVTEEQRAAWPAAPYVEEGSGLPTPGAGETLLEVMDRVAPLWTEIRAEIEAGRRVLVVGHGNSLRALCAVVDCLSPEEVQELNIPPGHPLVYAWSDGGLLPRGGRYLDEGAHAEVERIAAEGGT